MTKSKEKRGKNECGACIILATTFASRVFVSIPTFLAARKDAGNLKLHSWMQLHQLCTRSNTIDEREAG